MTQHGVDFFPAPGSIIDVLPTTTTTTVTTTAAVAPVTMDVSKLDHAGRPETGGIEGVEKIQIW